MPVSSLKQTLYFNREKVCVAVGTPPRDAASYTVERFRTSGNPVGKARSEIVREENDLYRNSPDTYRLNG